ncbi:hypothetical protein ACFC1R_24165 [Kitasatospora sp. NPDC056138]|uniref:hypothetical protein n=1 Tax=Kitasatospora sp. NPDC056138 TaxID=3345724 RepID=UPI0035DE7E53
MSVELSSASDELLTGYTAYTQADELVAAGTDNGGRDIMITLWTKGDTTSTGMITITPRTTVVCIA